VQCESKLRAAVFREYGRDPTKVVRIEDIESPKLEPNEVVIKTEAAAYNYNDLWAIWGEPARVPLPHISGSDAAGRVVEVGQTVKKIKPGDRVVSHSNLSCRQCNACTSGREYDCVDRKIWGFETGPLWGAFAEYVHLPEINVVKLPDNVSFNDAAAVSMVGMTSWHMLVSRARIRPGQTILVMGGRSGIGTIGIQIAKLFRCTVIATVGSDENVEKCLRLGADYVVNHREAEWYKRVREITKKQGVDVVFEHIGKSAFAQAATLLKMGGTLVTSGATTGYDSNIDLRYLFFKGTNYIGSTQGTRAELEEVVHWTSRGSIRPVIDTIYPFSEMVKGHVLMAEGRQFGKILTTPHRF